MICVPYTFCGNALGLFFEDSACPELMAFANLLRIVPILIYFESHPLIQHVNPLGYSAETPCDQL